MTVRSDPPKLIQVICLCVLVSCLSLANVMQTVGRSSGRIEIVEQFLKVIYPSLDKQVAMVKIDATLEAGSHVTVRSVLLYPCRPSGSVPAEQASLDPSTPNTPQDRRPWCGADPTPEYENYLRVFLDFGGDWQRPISRFATQGDFVDAKLQELRHQFGGKPYPSDEEAIRALLARNPRYGPNNKSEFLAVVPFAKIAELSSCRLDPRTAVFSSDRNGDYPDLQWHIFGTAPATKTLKQAKCSAAFEPFEGRLTLFLD